MECNIQWHNIVTKPHQACVLTCEESANHFLDQVQLYYSSYDEV